MVKSTQGMLFIIKSHLTAGTALNCQMQWHHSVSCGTVSAQCLWFRKGQNLGSIVVSKVAKTDHISPHFASLCWLLIDLQIIKYCTNLLLCAAAVWTLLLPSTWLNWKFTNQHTSYTLLWYFHSLSSHFLHAFTWSEIFSYMLHCLSGTVSLAKLDHQTHSYLLNHLWNLTSSSCPVDSWLHVYVHTQSLKSVLVYWFVMGHVLQFGEIACKKSILLLSFMAYSDTDTGTVIESV